MKSMSLVSFGKINNGVFNLDTPIKQGRDFLLQVTSPSEYQRAYTAIIHVNQDELLGENAHDVDYFSTTMSDNNGNYDFYYMSVGVRLDGKRNYEFFLQGTLANDAGDWIIHIYEID